MPTQIQAPDVFAAIASPVRREVLDLLRQAPRSVNELAVHFEMRRPSLSQHLGALRKARLVSVEVSGRQRIYHVEPSPLEAVADWLHPYEEFWRTKMNALADHLDSGVDN